MRKVANRWITVLLIGLFLLVSSGARAKDGWDKNYFSFPIIYLGVGYPSSVYTSLSTRFGKEYFGWGLYANLGASFGHAKGHVDHIDICINGGAKFYPYRGIFLAAGLGTLGVKYYELNYNLDGSFTLAGYYTCRGVELLAGYDVQSSGGWFLLQPCIGVGFDPWVGEFIPLLRLTLGWTKPLYN